MVLLGAISLRRVKFTPSESVIPWMQPRWPSTEEKIKRCSTYTHNGISLSREKSKRELHIRTTEYHSAGKSNKRELHIHTTEYHSAGKSNKCELHIRTMECYSAGKRNIWELRISTMEYFSATEKEQMGIPCTRCGRSFSQEQEQM